MYGHLAFKLDWFVDPTKATNRSQKNSSYTRNPKAGGTKKKEMGGMVFGMLTVQEATNYWDRGSVVWRCLCACGETIYFSSVSLLTDRYTSCGCAAPRANALAWRKSLSAFDDAPRIATINQSYKAYRQGAERRNLTFEMSLFEFKELVQQPCNYCGAEPKPFNGVDRIDPLRGYTTDNICSACRDCNLGKQQHTVEEFKAWVERVHDFMQL